MATPIGHSLLGAAIGAALSCRGDARRSAVIGAIAGMAADLDFIPGLLLGEPSRFHHAQSHSFVFAVLAATLATVVVRQGYLRWGLLVGMAYASHLALDMLTLDDSSPQGIPLFWPWWSAAFQSPISLLPNVLHGKGQALSPHNMAAAVREVGLLGPILGGAILFAKRSRRQSVIQPQPESRHSSKRLSIT